MKNDFFTSARKMPLNMLFIAAFSLILFSCSTEEVNEAELNASLETSAAAAKSDKAAPSPGELSIAEIALANPGQFSELVEALSYVDGSLDTGLIDMFLNGTDQYTVFAPTNDAFEELYQALEIGGITDLPADTVLNVLLYHVVEGRRAANSVVPKKNPKQIETLLGKYFYVTKDLGIEAIGNNANIQAANISASNGIIHVIDTVILPF
jgi:uncharacterized surface protein with fasciclin (FAS1) repeats